MSEMICNKAKECERVCEHRIEHCKDSLGGNFMCKESCAFEQTKGAVCVPLSPQEGVLLTETEIEKIAGVWPANEDSIFTSVVPNLLRAQTLKLVKWLKEPCPHDQLTGKSTKKECPKCWAALKKEAGK